MTSTITRFESRRTPCGRLSDGEQFLSEDGDGLITRDQVFTCGCQSHHEEFHDGSVHNLVVNHRGKVLVDEELRGE